MDVRPETTVTGQLRAATETGSVPAVPDSQQTEEKTTDRRSNDRHCARERLRPRARPAPRTGAGRIPLEPPGRDSEILAPR